MELAITLLMAAMSLLTSIGNSPNASVELKAQATLIANQAILFSQSTMENEKTLNPSVSIIPVSTTPVQFIQNITYTTPAPVQSVFGSVKPAPVVVQQVPTEIKAEIAPGSALYGGNCTNINFFVKVLDQNNIEMKNKIVSFINQETGKETIFTTTEKSDSAWANVSIVPQQLSGPMTVTFNSGQLSTQITVNLLSMKDRLVNADGSLNGARIDNPELPNMLTMVNSGSTFNLETNMCK